MIFPPKNYRLGQMDHFESQNLAYLQLWIHCNFFFFFSKKLHSDKGQEVDQYYINGLSKKYIF